LRKRKRRIYIINLGIEHLLFLTFSWFFSKQLITVKEKRPPQELSNGAVYTGEWVGNKKEG